MATQSHAPFWGPRVTVPSCRACGYAVKGLPSFTCPECGSDLREVGIDTPGAGREVLRRVKAAGGAAAEIASGAARALGAYAAALGRLMWLRAPVQSHPTTIDVRSDGRVVFDPPLRLPDGKHEAIVVISLFRAR